MLFESKQILSELRQVI